MSNDALINYYNLNLFKLRLFITCVNTFVEQRRKVLKYKTTQTYFDDNRNASSKPFNIIKNLLLFLKKLVSRCVLNLAIVTLTFSTYMYSVGFVLNLIQ